MSSVRGGGVNGDKAEFLKNCGAYMKEKDGGYSVHIFDIDIEHYGTRRDGTAQLT